MRTYICQRCGEERRWGFGILAIDMPIPWYSRKKDICPDCQMELQDREYQIKFDKYFNERKEKLVRRSLKIAEWEATHSSPETNSKDKEVK
jgi:hypothetical protein